MLHHICENTWNMRHMQKETSVVTSKKIPVSQLKTGMYVLAIVTDNDAVSVKSEGYIHANKSIEQIKRSGIKSVIVDPSREKTTEKKLAKKAQIPNAENKEQTTQKDVIISLEQEMKTASKLYQDAKELQNKILKTITLNKEINLKEVQESTDAIVDSIFRNQDALSCMSRLRIKDEYLMEHSLNVSILMTIFAKHLQLERNTIEQLALGAFLHDIGKIKVPSEILNKPAKLTPEEFEVIKSHVTLGINILKEIPQMPDVIIDIVHKHHERLNGSGYPNNVLGENISQYSRMIAIVDSYDAMTAERVYKAGMHPITAFKNLIKESPNAYDEDLVEKFISCLGVYPIGTLVKLTSGKLGLISKLNKNKPLQPFVRVFYNARLNQAIAMQEIDLSQAKVNDHIDSCIKQEEYNLNLLGFFKAAFHC